MLAAAVPAALADGDPASDVLFQRKLFVPYGWRDGAAGTSRLAALLEQAAAAGRPIRVAIIAAPQDLGSVPSLFGRPVEYARFLGAELQFVYHGRLLVVMPDGLGVSERGQPLVRAQQVLGDIRVRPNADGLVQSAVDATRTLLGETAARRRSRHARRLAPSSGRRTRDSTSTLTGNVAKGDLVHVRKFEAIVALALLTVLFVGAAAALTASQRRRAAAMVERR